MKKRRPLNTCRLELEDRELLAGLRDVPRAFKSFARPASVGLEWHHTENQGQLGSCQGNDLASCGERLAWVAGGARLQLSRIFAYLATQKIDGLLGADRGSTISGGAKLITTVGLPLEDLTGYPSRYPDVNQRRAILSDANYAAAAAHMAASTWRVPAEPDEARNWIGGGGAISLGIRWPGMPAGRVFRRFTGGRGGHAIAVLGYDSLDGVAGIDLRPGEPHLAVVNSHGDGPFAITDDAWVQMHRDSYTAAVGLAGDAEPAPRKVRIHLDW